MAEFLTYTSPSDVRKAVFLARKARLFIPGWNLFDTFIQANDEPEKFSVCICEEDGDRIAVGIVERVFSPYDNKKYMQVFVRKKHRRKGLGRQIVGILAKIEPDFSYGEGNKGSINFWNNVT